MEVFSHIFIHDCGGPYIQTTTASSRQYAIKEGQDCIYVGNLFI